MAIRYFPWLLLWNNMSILVRELATGINPDVNSVAVDIV